MSGGKVESITVHLPTSAMLTVAERLDEFKAVLTCMPLGLLFDDSELNKVNIVKMYLSEGGMTAEFRPALTRTLAWKVGMYLLNFTHYNLNIIEEVDGAWLHTNTNLI